MPGLTFDDGPSPDPQDPLAPWFDEWVRFLLDKRSERTAAGYVADLATVGRTLCEVVGKEPPALYDDQDLLTAACQEPRIQQAVAQGVGAASLAKARAVCEVLVLADLAPRNLGVVVDRLPAKDRQRATAKRRRAAWSSFCSFLVRREVLATNPMESSKVAKVAAPRTLPSPLELAEVERLFAEVARPDARSRDPWPARDLALCATFLATGIRLSEALTAKVGDAQSLETSPRLRVLGKGSKTRVVPLYDEAVDRLLTYLAERAERHGPVHGDDPLFVRADGSAFSPTALRRLVERWYARAGVRRHPGAAVHALRHTWATQALDAGASVIEVQAVLGHESLETTKRYLQVVGSGLDDTMRAHPTRRILQRTRQGRPQADTSSGRRGSPGRLGSDDVRPLPP